MAPIKFEDNIREKLEGREIEPSKDAWKKLSERLDANSKKKNNDVIWYAIAASIIGIFIAVTVFSNSGEKLNENATDLVEVNTSERQVINENGPNLVENTSEEKSKTKLASEESNPIKLDEKTNASLEKLLPKKNKVVIENPERNISEAIAKTSPEDRIEKMSQLPEEVISNDDLLINKRIDELVAQVEQLQQNNATVSVEEVNALLANAERKIRTQEILDSKKIDPAALLGDVELEMDNSFREKVFTALGDGLDIIKTAVVNRNN